MLNKLIRKMGKLTDPRVAGRTSHPLTNVMLIAFLATLSGETGWQAISDWGSFYAIELYRLLPSITSIPSADTFARVLAMVAPQEMAELTTSMAGELLRRYRGNRKRGRPRKDTTPELISIDGKPSPAPSREAEKSPSTTLSTPWWASSPWPSSAFRARRTRS